MLINVGTLDRVIRIGLGLALMASVFVGPQTPWGWLGVVPLLSGVLRVCCLYRALGISTCR